MMLIDSHGVAEVNSLEQFSGRGSCKVASVGGQGGGGHSTQTASLNQQHFLNIFNVKTNTQTHPDTEVKEVLVRFGGSVSKCSTPALPGYDNIYAEASKRAESEKQSTNINK